MPRSLQSRIGAYTHDQKSCQAIDGNLGVISSGLTDERRLNIPFPTTPAIRHVSGITSQGTTGKSEAGVKSSRYKEDNEGRKKLRVLVKLIE